MNDETRQRLSTAIDQLGTKYSGMRFGQLISFAAFLARGPVPNALWDVPDDELLAAIESHLTTHLVASPSEPGEASNGSFSAE